MMGGKSPASGTMRLPPCQAACSRSHHSSLLQDGNSPELRDLLAHALE
jgi:hypothetical protein